MTQEAKKSCCSHKKQEAKQEDCPECKTKGKSHCSVHGDTACDSSKEKAKSNCKSC